MHLLGKNVIERLICLVVFVQTLIKSFAQVENEPGSLVKIGGIVHFTYQYCFRSNVYIDSISVSNKGIDVIDVDAFQWCTEVTDISLNQNMIFELSENTFQFNGKLEWLTLNCNLLTFIPKQLFAPLKNLKALDISGNPLETITPVLQSNFNSLIELYFAEIGLYGFDPERVKKSLPALTLIGFSYNNLSCRKYEQLRTFFKNVGVEVHNYSYSCYPSSTICVDDPTEIYVAAQLNRIEEQAIKNYESKNDQNNVRLKEMILDLEKDFNGFWWILVILMICHVVVLTILLVKGLQNVSKNTARHASSEVVETRITTHFPASRIDG